MPSIVESDTITSVARVADDGIVAREEHTISVELLSVTLAKLGIVKYATAKKKEKMNKELLQHKIVYKIPTQKLIVMSVVQLRSLITLL